MPEIQAFTDFHFSDLTKTDCINPDPDRIPDATSGLVVRSRTAFHRTGGLDLVNCGMPKIKQHHGTDQNHLAPSESVQPHEPKVPKLMAVPLIKKVRQSLKTNPILELTYHDSQGVEQKISHRIVPEEGLPNGRAMARLTSLARIRVTKEIAECIIKHARAIGLENLRYMYRVTANSGRGEYALQFWSFGGKLSYSIFTLRDYVLLLRSCLEEPPGRSLRQAWHADDGLHFGERMRDLELEVLLFLGRAIIGSADSTPRPELLDWWQTPRKLHKYLKENWDRISHQLRGGPHVCPTERTVYNWCRRWLLIAQDRLVTADHGFLGDFRNPRPGLAVKQDGVELDLSDPRWFEANDDLPTLDGKSDRHAWSDGIEQDGEVSRLFTELVKVRPSLKEGLSDKQEPKP